MSANPDNPGQDIVPFLYKQFTGGLNLRAADSNISEDPQRLEFYNIQNVDAFRVGALGAQAGEFNLNPNTTDHTSINGIGIADLLISGVLTRYIVYTKASGNAWAMEITAALAGTGTEILVRSGLHNAPTYFTNFNANIIAFNGVDPPWEWNGTLEQDLQNVPWGTNYPNVGVPFFGHLFVCSKNTVYWSNLGDENHWNGVNDAGSFSEIFNDITSFSAMVVNGASITLHSPLKKVYVIEGTTTNGSNPFHVDQRASNRSATTQSSVALIDNREFFFTGDGIKNFSTTLYGFIILDSEPQSPYYDLLEPLKSSSLSGEVLPVPNVNQSANIPCVLTPYLLKNQMLCYFQSVNSQNGEYDLCYIYDFTNHSWYPRSLSPITASTTCQELNAVISGTFGGNVIQQFKGATDYLGNPINKSIRTPWFQWNQSHRRKRIVTTHLWFDNVISSPIIVNYYSDFDAGTIQESITLDPSDTGITNPAHYWPPTSYGTTYTYGGASINYFHWSTNIVGQSIQIEILNSGATNEFLLRQMLLEVEFLDSVS